jgi:2,4-dienoyl-CoA reductase-like NADH-dependent reductase (Old Yellow Enzyme family)/thioredoxin reductase
MKQFKKLLEAGQIGKLAVKNRMVMSPMVTCFAGDKGEVTQRMVDYYAERARGGVGLIVIEATYYSAGKHPGRLSIHDDEFIPGLRWLLNTIHEADCKAAIEINPSQGRKDAVQPVCASDVPISRYIPSPRGDQKPKVLTIEEIRWLVKEFGNAARRVKEIGFDAVMVHGAGPYLITEFLSPLTNKRTDEFGGDIKGRAKLAIELLQSVRKEAGDNFPIIFRLSVDQRVMGGLTINDALIVCQMLEKAGCSAIDVVSGSHAATEWSVPPNIIPAGCNVDLAAGVKSKVKIPVMVVGKINDPFLAEGILEQGKADFITLGRALIADPDLPKKAREARTEEIRHCLACNICHENVVVIGLPLKCTVNPEVGREREWKITRADKIKKVLVIGGGPGGMEAARISALRGHAVTLWEKRERLGGQLNIAAVPPHKEGLKELLSYLEVQIQKSGVAVELNKEATVESVIGFAPDVVIVANGSKPMFPEISGIKEQKTRVLFAEEVLNGNQEVGPTVVIIGGELVGCETGDFLTEKAKKVTITSLLPEIATNLPGINRFSLLRRLEEKGVTMLPNVEYDLITEEGVIITTAKGEKRFLEADNIILCAGLVPENQLFQSLLDKVKECYAVGDCIQPRKILEATEEAADIARKI